VNLAFGHRSREAYALNSFPRPYKALSMLCLTGSSSSTFCFGFPRADTVGEERLRVGLAQPLVAFGKGFVFARAPPSTSRKGIIPLTLFRAPIRGYRATQAKNPAPKTQDFFIFFFFLFSC